MDQLLLDSGRGYSSQRGEVVVGTVMHVEKDALLVDVGLKSEGMLPLREMRTLAAEERDNIKVGDKILVRVLTQEGPEGYAILSCDKARSEKGWHLLQEYLDKGEAFEGEVVGYNKGGVLVNVYGVQGFAPISQLASVPRATEPDPENHRLGALVGQKVVFKVLELNRKRNRVILSERVAQQERRQHLREHLLSELKEGQIREGRVTGLSTFGAFVDLGGVDGLIHISELSWVPVRSPEEVLKVGDQIPVYVLKIDPETQRIALSLRRTKQEPWENIQQNYHVGQLVSGTITKIVAFGAFARLEGPVEGLIHISELANRPLRHPREVVKEGDTLTLKIINIEPERKRLSLSLRQTEEQKETGLGMLLQAEDRAAPDQTTAEKDS